MLKKYFLSLLLALLITATHANTLFESGFLKPNEYSDGILLLPPPPTEGSILSIYDRMQYEKAKAFRHTERGKQAILDAKIFEPNFGIAKVFTESFGYELNKKDTPNIIHLLYKLGLDSDLATKEIKKHYMTTRPFVFYNHKTCYPRDEKYLRTNGGYPSGHTTYGWVVALVLAEINPNRQNQILKRGFEIGQSRVICGFHWQSDVDAGRLVASALLARLHAHPEFIEQLNKAKQEFKRLQETQKK